MALTDRQVQNKLNHLAQGQSDRIQQLNPIQNGNS